MKMNWRKYHTHEMLKPPQYFNEPRINVKKNKKALDVYCKLVFILFPHSNSFLR